MICIIPHSQIRDCSESNKLRPNLSSQTNPTTPSNVRTCGEVKLPTRLCKPLVMRVRAPNNIGGAVQKHRLWFNFILGLNFIFFCFKLIIIHYHTQKQKKIKFKPRIKLNHNTYIVALRFGDLTEQQKSWKVWPVSNFAKQLPTGCANRRNMQHPTMLEAVDQQCCVRLHEALELWSVPIRHQRFFHATVSSPVFPLWGYLSSKVFKKVGNL